MTMNKLSIYAGLMILSVSSAGVLHAAPVKADADGNRIRWTTEDDGYVAHPEKAPPMVG